MLKKQFRLNVGDEPFRPAPNDNAYDLCEEGRFDVGGVFRPALNDNAYDLHDCVSGADFVTLLSLPFLRLF